MRSVMPGEKSLSDILTKIGPKNSCWKNTRQKNTLHDGEIEEKEGVSVF